MKSLRTYQTQCIDTIKIEYENGCDSQLINLATGTGKTYLAVCSKELLGLGRTLFICHRDELIQQSFETFSEQYPMQVGIVKADLFEINKEIVIASIQTLHRRLDKIPSDWFEYVIYDECHHASSITASKSIRYFDKKLLVGLSATPTRMDNLSLSNIFDKITFTYDIADGIKDGFLCELDAIRIKTQIDLSKLHKVAGDFNQKELSMSVDTPERNALIVEKYIQYGQNRQAIFFCVDIEHTKNLTQAFRDRDIDADFVVSDTNECVDRKGVFKAFKSGLLKVLLNVNIATEGFDYSDVGVVGMARPTQSLAMYIQCVGRGTRLKSKDFQFEYGKNDCIILDFVDNVGNHKLINTWTLDSGKEIEDRVFVSKEKKNKLLADREKRNSEIKSKYTTDKKVDLLELPKIKVSTSEKMLEPATEKQIAWLQREGVWIEGTEYTKKQANEWINTFEASDKQKWLLGKIGYDVSKGCTVSQAKEAFRLEDEKNGIVKEGFSPVKF